CYQVDDNDFYFQAADGIRDRNVTGVQTCALTISWTSPMLTSQRSCTKLCVHPTRLRKSAAKLSVSSRSLNTSLARSSIVTIQLSLRHRLTKSRRFSQTPPFTRQALKIGQI